ncbi:chemotaxis protein CheW [Pleurocapsales cyanobacterium LEGE 06147]|nr:chemotaxis protein CheW [Pleurocapsales cyanobacterium LEGE 06147]
MESKPYLIFSLHGLPYAIDARRVREIFLLPELTPIEEAPEDIVGLLNLRSKVVPILHLDLRFKRPFRECHINDNVIVLESQELLVGVIVHEVDEIKLIDSSVIETDVTYGRVRDLNSAFVNGVAKIDNDLIILLDVENLIRYPQTVKALIAEVEERLDEIPVTTQKTDEIKEELTTKNPSIDRQNIINSFYDLCCPRATPKEKEIFRQRADNLRLSNEPLDSSEQIPIAVIALNNEYFGIDLEFVREFTKINNITAIPCCPEHIIGQTNLRGEIVTLVDIRRTLNLASAMSSNVSKAVVIDVDDTVAGLPVDEVFDVMYLDSDAINYLPLAVASGPEKYLKGTVSYQDKMLSFLDLPKIFALEN